MVDLQTLFNMRGLTAVITGGSGQLGRVNLGYADYRKIDPQEWKGREQEGNLLVLHVGEMLYRASSLIPVVRQKLQEV
jgi:hypothetical protein